MSSEALIVLAIVAPLLGAVGIVLAGHKRPNLREAVTLVTAVGLVALVWSLLPGIVAGDRPYIRLLEFIPGLAVEFRVEPLGMLFAALASLLWVVNSIYSIGYMRGNKERNQTRFYVLFAVALSAAMGVAFSGNLLTLFIFYEILTLVPGGILQGRVDGIAVGLLLALFVFGIGKAAIMPVHRWLPAAMVAPTPVSALLHAVAVVKAGVFTISKVVVYIFGIDFVFGEPSGTWLLYVAAFTIIAASVIALRQTNLKRLLAYSTISQLSYVVMAVAIMKPIAEIGAAVHIVTHAFGKITLFFAAGAIYTASKKTEIVELRGIGRRMPWTMTAFTIGALSMIGVPPTGGFVSKWYILAGAFQADNYVAIATVIVSTLLNAAYFLPIIYLVWFQGEQTPPVKDHGEAPLAAVIALVVTAGLTLAFFFFHQTAVELATQFVQVSP